MLQSFRKNTFIFQLDGFMLALRYITRDQMVTPGVQRHLAATLTARCGTFSCARHKQSEVLRQQPTRWIARAIKMQA